MLLLGASGSGKSTVLQALAGVLGGDDDGERVGELTIDGIPAETARGRAGLVLQDPDSQVILARVGDDVAFGCENLGVPREQIWPRVREALDAVGLRLPLDHPTTRLSGGQKQRLALAGVLAMRPGLLLLDEPTANLDPQGVVEVTEAVDRVLADTGATLVVVEHRVETWLPVVGRLVVLSRTGSVIADGAPDAVLAARGDELAASGVWVPGRAPRPRRVGGAGGATLLTANRMAVGRSTALRSDIDLELREGELTVVTGSNGVGKSTLGLTLGGLIPPVKGELAASPELARGRAAQPVRWRSRDLLTRIGTVFQEPEHQFLAATVRAELEVGPRALGLSADEIAARVDELLERLRLDRLAPANPFTLSGGEKRRLSVATVLATRPRLLVLDEPTFGQDSRTWDELVALLADTLDAGSSVVAITHDSAFADALADRRVAL